MNETSNIFFLYLEGENNIPKILPTCIFRYEDCVVAFWSLSFGSVIVYHIVLDITQMMLDQ
jgi:hypothetical protein